MKIALFLDAPRYGGAERYFVELCNGLSARGHDVAAIAPESAVADELRARLDGPELVALPPIPQFGDLFLANVVRASAPFRAIRSTLRDLAPNLLHICNGGYPGSHLSRSAPFAWRGPSVMTVNNRAQARAGMRGKLYPVLDGLLWRRLDAVICPSRATGEALVAVRDLPASKLQVVYYGIDERAANGTAAAAVRQELGLADDAIVVGIIAAPDATARHAGHKGHDVLVEALAATRDPRLAVVAVGHDPGPDVLRLAEDLGVRDRVRIAAGFRDAAPYLALFDVLAVPSRRNEALPVVMLEAFAASTPVVGSRLSGIPEAVVHGESGYIFEPGDAKQLAAILDRLASDAPERERLGASARKRYEELFTRDRMIDATLAVYADVVQA